MADLPLTGTYTAQDSDNNTYQIHITSATPWDGQINGSYTASDGPFGLFTKEEGQIGKYFWVGSPAGGNVPFSVYFVLVVRPGGWPYCICDTWTGAYMEDNTLLMEGVRSFVSADGTLKLTSFRELKFFRQAV